MKNRKMLVNMLAAMITLLVQMGISFWLSPFVVSKLGEEAYGFLNLANNFVAYASLVSVAVNSMACRYISVEYNCGNIEESKKYFCSVFIVNCFLYAVILAVSSIFFVYLERFVTISPALVTQVKITFLISFINTGTSLLGTVYTAATFTTNLMHLSSVVQIVANIVRGALILILFMILPPQIYYLSIATLISGIVTLAGNYKLTKSLLADFQVRLSYFDGRKILTLIKSGVWVLLSNVSNLLLNGLDLLISNLYISPAMMGRLSIAKQIPAAISNALGMLSSIFSSALTKVFAEEGQKSLTDVTNQQLRILGMVFTVPYAGVLVFGYDFLELWLKSSSYTNVELHQIYILMILVLVDIIVSTYMYSIHSVFIALDAIRSYSVILLATSVVSVSLTVCLLRLTPLGVYAIAGTSTVVLGITHGIIVPGKAAKLLGEKMSVFWKTELSSWGLLCILTAVFFAIKQILAIDTWGQFAVMVCACAAVGYLLTFCLYLSKKEKRNIIRSILTRK